MKKLKVNDLADADNLSDEEKQAILGGAAGQFDLKLSGGNLDDARRARRIRGLRDVRKRDFRKRDVRQFGGTSKQGGTNV